MSLEALTALVRSRIPDLDEEDLRKRYKRIERAIFLSCDRSGGPDSCWTIIYKRPRPKHQPSWYSYINIQGREFGAHRVALALVGVTFPIEAPRGGLGRGRGRSQYIVCHTCNNKGCLNPRHMFVGSQSENVQHSVRGVLPPLDDPRRSHDVPANYTGW